MEPFRSIGNMLFSVFLSECVARFVSNQATRVGRLLCPRCEDEQQARVQNITHNNFYCTTCGNHYQQFLNATPHTVNDDCSVISASISRITTRVPERGQMELANRLDVIHSIHEPVVLESRLGEPHRLPFYSHRTGLITPKHNDASWKTSCIVPVEFFPLRATHVAVELTVYNTWGEKLDWRLGSVHTLEIFQRMIELEYELLRLEQRLLALEYMQLSLEQRHSDQRFTELTLKLAEHLLGRT